MPMEDEHECDVSFLGNKLCVMIERNKNLEKENQQLKQEVLNLKSQIALLQSRDADRRLIPWKKVESSISNNSSSQEKPIIHSSNQDEGLMMDRSFSKSIKERSLRVPSPPPRPTYSPSTLKPNGKVALVPPLPPPPPPLSLKLQGEFTNAVRRVPEVVELYRSLARREGKHDGTRSAPTGAMVVSNAREMIGEIENRSAYLLAIKSDVETQGEFISLLTREVENATFMEISDLETFVKWLDKELSYLADERAVLKHFPQWPERKADMIREAAFAYRDLKNLESEVLSFRDDMHNPTTVALKRIQALQDKLELSVHNLERVREGTSKRYRDFKIPCDWMLDNGVISQLKLGSMKLAKDYMNRVVSAVQSNPISEDEDLILKGVRFAFRVHQFVGGFDEESRHAFQELRKLANICNQLDSISRN